MKLEYEIGDKLRITSDHGMHKKDDIVTVEVVDPHDDNQTYRCRSSGGDLGWTLTSNIERAIPKKVVYAKVDETKVLDVLKLTLNGELYLLTKYHSGTRQYNVLNLKSRASGIINVEAIEDDKYIYIHNISDIYNTLDI